MITRCRNSCRTGEGGFPGSKRSTHHRPSQVGGICSKFEILIQLELKYLGLIRYDYNIKHLSLYTPTKNVVCGSNQEVAYRPFSHCIDQAGLGAFTAKSGRKHYNPPPLTVMWMNFDSPNFPSFCSLSATISFQTCSNKCILYVLSFHKCIKIKYKMVNMYGVFRD